MALEVVNAFGRGSRDILAKHVNQGASLDTIKFLLEQGASTDQVLYNSVRFASLEMIKLLLDNEASLENGGKIGRQLVNRDNTEVVLYIINEMAVREIKITAEVHDNYPRYIVYEISRNMYNCEGNKIIADYAGLTGQINWSECE